MKENEILKLDFPLPRPHCGMPMGNGRLGALIWGRDKICVTVSRADYWDYRYGESYLGPHYKKLLAAYDPHDVKPINDIFVRKKIPDWRPTQLPCGRFELELIKETKAQQAVIDYASGTVNIYCGNRRAISFHMGLEQDLLMIEDPDAIINKVEFVSAWGYIGDELEKFDFKEPEKVENGEIQSIPEQRSLAAIYARKEYGYAITLEWGKDGKSAYENSRVILNEHNSETIKMQVSEWWKEYWRNSAEIDIPDEFLNEFYKFAIYKFACATHPNGVPCALQGPWAEEYQRTPWRGDYHFNVNVQQVYTLAFGAGCLDNLMPLFDMLDSEPFQRTMRDNARNMFGIDDGLLLTHAVDCLGRQTGWISAGAVLDFACGGWTAQLYWLYYKYTLDENFLKKRALPFTRGVMRVFEETLEEVDGKLSIPLSISAEYGCCFKIKKDGSYVHQNTGRDSSYQLSCMHMLADYLIEASEIIGEEPEPVWLDIKKRLPHYTLVDEENPHIAIWQGQDLDVCHRHHSHLACIYPFDTLPSPNQEQQNVLDNSIDHWILMGMGQWSEWCYPWAAIIQTRMGFKEAPAVLLNLWKEIFINEGMATVYLPRFQGITAHRREDMLKPRETNEIMQLDGTMAGATALIEMLVHQKGDTVYLFRGIPEKWYDLSFKNIRLPGAFSISASQKNGKLESCRIKSLKGGTLKLFLNDCIQELSFQPNEEKAFS